MLQCYGKSQARIMTARIADFLRRLLSQLLLKTAAYACKLGAMDKKVSGGLSPPGTPDIRAAGCYDYGNNT
jgi:hypothetical protein